MKQIYTKWTKYPVNGQAHRVRYDEVGVPEVQKLWADGYTTNYGKKWISVEEFASRIEKIKVGV